MTHRFENFVQFYSKFYKFHKLEQYTDIRIECESTHFQCHQVVLAAACPYFHSLFRSRDVNEPGQIRPLVQLNEMKAVTFQAVLQFIYTGDTLINSDNIYNLIVASDFLDFKCLEEQCLQYLKKTSTFKDYVEIINYFAHQQEHRFVNVIRDHVIENVELFLENGAYYELPVWFQHKVLHDQKFAHKTRHLENALALLVERQHSNTLPELPKLQDPHLVQSEQLSLDACTCIGSTITGNTISSENFLISESRNALKVFVDCRDRSLELDHVPKDNCVDLFEVDENMNCFPTSKFSQILNIDHGMKCVAIDKTRLFSLDYYQQKKHNRTANYQFSVCGASIDGPFETILKSPASSKYTSHFYELCEMKKSVLFHDQLIKQEYPICRYNDELDTWSKLPKMIEQKIGACVVYSNDTQLLYAIGGQSHDTSNNFVPTNTVQAYDHRMNGWQQLPGTILTKSWAACCLHKGKIFVSGGVHGRNEFCEVYHPDAGKWEEFQSMIKGWNHHRMIQHRNALWVVGGWEDMTINLSISKYDPLLNTWCTSPSLEILYRGNMRPKVLDAVVFEPHST